MKSERFTPLSLFIERTRMREGPPVAHLQKRFTSKSFTDTKQLLASFGGLNQRPGRPSEIGLRRLSRKLRHPRQN